MSDLKELVVIIGLALGSFWLARMPLCKTAMNTAEFDRRRNLWVVLTVLAFVSHSFWIYIVVAALILSFWSIGETNRLAMFLALLLVVPIFSQAIPGFGGIQQFISLSHVRLLSLTLLLPAYLMIRGKPEAIPFGRKLADKLLLAYLAEQVILQIFVDSFTNTARYAIYSFTDVFLPYYVASRGSKDLQTFRDTVSSMFFAIVITAPVALFEYFKGWLLYGNLSGTMGVVDKMGSYMARGESIRAVASSQHSIVLGYLMTVALGLALFVREFIAPRALFVLAVLVSVAALIAAGARGPWVGALAVASVIMLTGAGKFGRTLRIMLIAIPVLTAMSFTDFGRRLFDLLPFIGTVDTASVDYRRQLFDISLLVIGQHPWLGAFDYLINPAMQDLIQGEGIIDVVNSFLGVALTYGLVGLTLFCGVFAASAWGVWTGIRGSAPGSEASILGRSLLAVLAGVLVTITTVSSIGVVPVVYWIVAGLCVGYGELVRSTSALPSDPQDVALMPRAAHA